MIEHYFIAFFISVIIILLLLIAQYKILMKARKQTIENLTTSIMLKNQVAKIICQRLEQYQKRIKQLEDMVREIERRLR